MGCCAKIKHELFHASMYDLSDGPTANKFMDIEETFAPRPHLFFLGVKFAVAVWLFASMVVAILGEDPHRGFWFAYLSNWGIFFTVLYAICSFVSAALLAYHRPSQQRRTELTGQIGVFLKITWTFFALAFPAELVITLLFWVLIFDGNMDLDYTMFIIHGVAWIVIGIDGCCFSRIPLRMKQLIFVESFSVCYLVWSVLHSVLNVGNPWYTNKGENDPIYSTVDWKDKTGFTIALSVGLLFVGLPIVFLLCRALSRSLPMRYRIDDTCEAVNDDESLEMPTQES